MNRLYLFAAEQRVETYLATWTKIKRHTARTFRRGLPFYVGIALHPYSK